MNVDLHPAFSDSLIATDTAAAIEACVHCGFCLATCPTYLDSRDERDSPRGRIYLVRDLLETGSATPAAQYHLDRCLTCRSCETTCPSGVRYGDIADGGRELMEAAVPRGIVDRTIRQLIREVIPRSAIMTPLLRLGQLLRPLFPETLRRKVPARQTALSPASGSHARQIILFDGCIQAAATPRTNQAARAILDTLSIGIADTPKQACCGALRTHLAAREDGLDDMRRNIDIWWPAIEAGAEAIISTATGCGSQIADYGPALARDPAYADKARRVSQLANDLAAFLLRQPLSRLPVSPDTRGRRIAVQIPCSQTHALRQPDSVRNLLEQRGFQLCATRDDHLCCGSAGSYSILQPAMAARLRERKLDALTIDAPDVIASANIGCQLHLDTQAVVAVKHWTELVHESLP